MEKHTEVLKRLVVSRRRDGRCIYDAEAKLDLIRASLQPGVSIARLAMEHGVNANLLRTWIARYQREEHSQTIEASNIEMKRHSMDAFIPVQMETAAEGHLSSGVPVATDTARDITGESTLPSMMSIQKVKPHLSVRLHVQLPNGVGFDIAEIEMECLLPVVEMLGNLPCSDSTTR
jgi:transposase